MTGTSDCNLKVVCFHDMAKEHAIKYTIRILSPEKSLDGNDCTNIKMHPLHTTTLH